MLQNILSFLHQLPQNIIGAIVWLFTNPKQHKCSFDGQWHTYFIAIRFTGGWGISLGNFIFFGHKPDLISVRHKRGHQMQSIYLGWLYLLVVGLPSFVRCIWDAFFHRRWSNEKRIRWYYSGYPEKWADNLGKNERFL